MSKSIENLTDTEIKYVRIALRELFSMGHEKSEFLKNEEQVEDVVKLYKKVGEQHPTVSIN